jgi:hypothetical protein
MEAGPGAHEPNPLYGGEALGVKWQGESRQAAQLGGLGPDGAFEFGHSRHAEYSRPKVRFH